MLGRAIDVSIIPAPEIFIQAMRVQKPAILHQPESLTARQFGEIAEIVFERANNEV